MGVASTRKETRSNLCHTPTKKNWINTYYSNITLCRTRVGQSRMFSNRSYLDSQEKNCPCHTLSETNKNTNYHVLAIESMPSMPFVVKNRRRDSPGLSRFRSQNLEAPQTRPFEITAKRKIWEPKTESSFSLSALRLLFGLHVVQGLLMSSESSSPSSFSSSFRFTSSSSSELHCYHKSYCNNYEGYRSKSFLRPTFESNGVLCVGGICKP